MTGPVLFTAVVNREVVVAVERRVEIVVRVVEAFVCVVVGVLVVVVLAVV